MADQPPRGTGGDDYPTFDPGPTPQQPPRRTPAPQPRRGGPAPPHRQPPPTEQPNPWLVGLAIATVLAAISVIAFGLLAPDGTATAASTSSTSTTATGDTDTTTGDTTPGETTVPDGTGTTDTPATIPSGGSVPTIASVGVAIPIADLTMSSNDIGPLGFGDAGDDVLGRLVSTFGQPTDDTGFIVGDGGFGECPGESIRIVRWGPLNVITRGEPSDHVFVSYRMDLKWGGITSPTTDMATLSGLRVGDTVGELESIYEDFDIRYVVDQDVGLTFELRADAGGDVLLWGPVDSQAADALVQGIYSPDPCQAGGDA